MYFLLVSFLYIAAAHISLKGASEKGLRIQYDPTSFVDEGYVLDTIASATQKEADDLPEGFTGEGRRRLLDTPSMSPTYEPSTNPTFEPTTNPSVSPSSNPTVCPTFNPTVHPSFSPSQEPSFSPTQEPSTHPTYEPTLNPIFNPTKEPTVNPTFHPTQAPVISTTITSTTTEATIPIMSTSRASNDNGGSEFAGFDLSSGGGISLFVFSVILLLAVLALILGGPYLYRRYHETFGSKTIKVEGKMADTKSLSEIWEETKERASKSRLSQISKSKLASSFGSGSKIEIAPIRTEDKIMLAEPIE